MLPAGEPGSGRSRCYASGQGPGHCRRDMPCAQPLPDSLNTAISPLRSTRFKQDQPGCAVKSGDKPAAVDFVFLTKPELLFDSIETHKYSSKTQRNSCNMRACGGAVGLLFVRMPHRLGAAGTANQWTDQLPIDRRWPLPRSQRRFPARHCIQLWPGLEGYSWLEPHIRTLPDLPGSGVATDTTPVIQPGSTSSCCRQ